MNITRAQKLAMFRTWAATFARMLWRVTGVNWVNEQKCQRLKYREQGSETGKVDQRASTLGMAGGWLKNQTHI